MKKRKTFIIIALIVALLLLGIGYAAISGITLNIAGTASATANPDNFKVKFTGTPTTSDATKVEASITDDINATIKVEGLTAKGDSVTATYTVLNDSDDLTANLSAEVSKNTNSEYFSVTPVPASATIAKGETTTVTITVTLEKTPVDADVTGEIGVSITASPVQP